MSLLTSTRDTRHLEQTLGSFQSKLIRKSEVISLKNLQNWIFVKNGNFLAKKIHDFQFSKGYHYFHTLEDTQEKTLGSFQPKLMTKIEVISQKPSKNWIFGKKLPFSDTFRPIKSSILNFPMGITTHTRQQTLRRRLQEVFSQK